MWTPEPAWTFGERANLLSLPGIEPKFPGCLACSVVTVPAAMCHIPQMHVTSREWLAVNEVFLKENELDKGVEMQPNPVITTSVYPKLRP